MIEQMATGTPKILGDQFTGKLSDDDYQTFVPTLDAAVVSQDHVQLFGQFEDFQGWDLAALWDEIKVDVKHAASFDRIALVGDSHWEKWMALMAKPLHQGHRPLLPDGRGRRRLGLAP